MRYFIPPLLALVLAASLAACAGGNSHSASATTVPTTAVASTTTAAPATTAVSERLEHWREVVADMNCDELATIEKQRMAIQFNDQAESLIAIHDRQAKLHCPF